jgi:hypothetical protein
MKRPKTMVGRTAICLGLGALLTMAIGASASDAAPDELISRSANWQDLRAAHKALGGRLDGVVAGAFTDKVAELFAERWISPPEFARLSAKDPVFGSAVMAAVNEAVTQDQAAMMRNNATHKCPPDQVRVCDRLVQALDAAAKKGGGVRP